MSSASQRLQMAAAKVADFEPEKILARFAELPSPRRCEHAEQFLKSADDLCSSAIGKRTVLAIHEAKVHLLDRYIEWCKNVPVRHQADDAIFAEDGHACIYSVFRSAYQRLLDAQVVLSPLPLCEARESRSPYDAPRSRFDGIVVGELGPDPEFG